MIGIFRVLSSCELIQGEGGHSVTGEAAFASCDNPVLTPHSGAAAPGNADPMLAHLLLPWQVLTGVEISGSLETYSDAVDASVPQ